MSTATVVEEIRDDTVLEHAPSVLEVAIGLEAIVWGASPVPLHLNSSALATWWSFEGPTRVDTVIRGVAETFGETPELVGPGVRFAVAMLLDAGLLVDYSGSDPSTAEVVPPEVPRAPRTASIDPRAARWLEHRVGGRVELTIGSVTLAVAADTDVALRTLSDRFAPWIRIGDAPAPIRYLLVDTADRFGVRHWLLSDAGLPLGCAASLDDLLDDLAVYLGEELAVQSGGGMPLRLGVLEAGDHCVAVQWDLLASRPMIEEPLGDLGYRITPRQWAIVDHDCNLLAAEPLDVASTSPAAPVPLRGVVLWFGPGSLDVPHTVGEWVWSLVMTGCAGADHRPTDREGLLAAAQRLAGTTRLVALTDPGPSSLVAAIGELAHGEPS